MRIMWWHILFGSCSLLRHFLVDPGKILSWVSTIECQSQQSSAIIWQKMTNETKRSKVTKTMSISTLHISNIQVFNKSSETQS